jgi:hypothetical protein
MFSLPQVGFRRLGREGGGCAGVNDARAAARA